MFNINDSCIIVVNKYIKENESDMRGNLYSDDYHQEEITCTCCQRKINIEGTYRGENYDIVWEVDYVS